MKLGSVVDRHPVERNTQELIVFYRKYEDKSSLEMLLKGGIRTFIGMIENRCAIGSFAGNCKDPCQNVRLVLTYFSVTELVVTVSFFQSVFTHSFQAVSWRCSGFLGGRMRFEAHAHLQCSIQGRTVFLD